MKSKQQNETRLKDLGIKIRQARKFKGLSQVKLAELMNCRNTRISHWEKGKREPGAIAIIDLKKLIDLEI